MDAIGKGPAALGLGSLGNVGALVDATGRVPARLASDATVGDAERVAKELEALFATMLVKEMRKGMSGAFFGEGSTADIYGGWFDEHVGRSLSESGAFDLVGIIKAGLPKDAPRADGAGAAPATSESSASRAGSAQRTSEGPRDARGERSDDGRP